MSLELAVTNGNRPFKSLFKPILSVLIVSTVCWTIFNVGRCKEPGTLDYLELFAQIVEIVQSTYLEETDPEVLSLGAVEGMLLNVSHYCTIIPLKEGNPLIPSYGSVDAGLVLGYREPLIRIIDVLPGSIGESAGFQSGDAILRIEDQVTPFLTIDRAQRMISGDIGKKIDFVIQRSATGQFEEIHLKLIPYAEQPDLQIGWGNDPYYLHPQGEITQETIKKIRTILMTADLSKGLLIDMRHVNAGDERMGLQLADIFIEDGQKIGIACDSEGKTLETFKANDGMALTEFPLVVIIDSTCAGPAETCAVALKESNRAVITGNNSFGKAVNLSELPLDDRYSIAIVQSLYCMRDGSSIQDSGIEPDVTVVLPVQDDTEDPFVDTAMTVMNTLRTVEG
jgi:carboxyl-terminal processing protease